MSLHTFSDTSIPMTVARAQTGEIYMHNGNDRPQRWDGITAATEHSGITAPTTEVTAAGSGSGSLSGSYTVYTRFIDDDGIPSNFSPSGTSLTLASDAQVDYSSIPQPTAGEPRVSLANGGQIQLWRNTDGQEITWYLDATVDTGTTVATSTKTDAQLQASTALRFYTADGYPNAMRFTPPATEYKVIVNHMDRMWFAGTTSTDADDRNTIMFSEANEPESVPSVNSLTLQEDGDEIVGLMPIGPYLYILKRRHIYQLATSGDPRRDASVVLVADRGCLNQRCWTRVESTAFLLDENGAYVMKGSEVQALDTPVRNFVTDQIDWDDHALYHVAKDADQELVQFFVTLGSGQGPRHALTYHYRLNRWSLDSFASFDAKASGEAEISGVMRLVIAHNSQLKIANDATVSHYDSMVPFTYKLGEYRLLPTHRDNVRRFSIWFDPISSFSIYAGAQEDSSSSSSSFTHTQTIRVKVYWNGSSTAETPLLTQDNEKGVTTTAGTAGYVVDLSNTEGFASFRFDGGLDTDALNYKTVAFELSGNTSRPLNIHRIEIDGVQ